MHDKYVLDKDKINHTLNVNYVNITFDMQEALKKTYGMIEKGENICCMYVILS